MYISANADDYAAARLNIFFPADSGPPASGEDGDLTGQCVSLNKWFMNDMSEVPSPFAARGDARYVGQTLVNQGLAVAVPAGQQKRGDMVVYEYGQYGHIGVLLSGNRLFQENVNTAGATKKVLSDGTVVYSSTIVPVYASLGGVAPKYYRLKSYKENANMNPDKEKAKYYPNAGDIKNIGDQNHQWNLDANGNPTPEAVAYWCYGTGNKYWGNPNDVWTALVKEVGEHDAQWEKDNQPPSKFKPVQVYVPVEE